MPRETARMVALRALREWSRGQRFADSIIQELLQQTRLEERDRGFALELFYGVLRNLTLLDFWIGLLRKGDLDDATRFILRLGLYQLLLLRTPQHAAVNETVSLAGARARPLVNAVLRAAGRRQAELESLGSGKPLPLRTSHPEWLVRRWQSTFGDQAATSLCEWNNRPPPVYARINGLKIKSSDYVIRYPEARPIPDRPQFVELESIPQEALQQGLCYIQDPSTALACELLAPEPGETILDACAAPGGKAGYLAELMQNRGKLIATDRDPDRIGRLIDNLSRLGVTMAEVRRIDWEQQTEDFPDSSPDRILLDAPCSNTGVMRRRVDVRWRLTSNDFTEMQKRQLTLARHLLPLLKPGGVLVYSTCSIESEENEEVVTALQNAFPGLELVETKQILPFRDSYDGAFAAKLRRN